MNLRTSNLSEWVEILGSEAGAPGGGSASALTAANGAALLCMTARLSLSKKGLEEFYPLFSERLAKLDSIKLSLLALVDLDSLSFEGVSNVFLMPKETDEDKALRKQAMQSALKTCTETPLNTMNTALSALKIAEEMQGKINPNVSSDFNCGVLSLVAGIRGAYYNVKINLDGIKDEGFVTEKNREAEEILNLSLGIENKLLAR